MRNHYRYSIHPVSAVLKHDFFDFRQANRNVDFIQLESQSVAIIENFDKETRLMRL